MQRPYRLYSILVIVLLLSGCVAASSPTPPTPTVAQTDTSGVSSTETAAPNPDSVHPYLNCLSPALQMNVARAAHTATLLSDGRVLIAGGFREEGTSEISIASAELFDPATQTFTLLSDMNEPRNGHTATLLPNGQVLIAGGWGRNGRTSTAEIFDPQTGRFEYTGSMMAPRQGFTATLLKDGKVLIAGGDSARNTPQPTAELYDPVVKGFTPTGRLNHERFIHTATLLDDGRVLLVGGTSGSNTLLASAEIYDPDTGEFTLTGSATVARYKHAAVLLKGGDVLILGGSDQTDWRGRYASAEIYDFGNGVFTKTSDMSGERFKFSDAVALLPDGNVLVGGGNRQIEIFDTQNRRFLLSDSLDREYFSSVATLLQNGQVLITGGYDPDIQPSSKAWLYCG